MFGVFQAVWFTLRLALQTMKRKCSEHHRRPWLAPWRSLALRWLAVFALTCTAGMVVAQDRQLPFIHATEADTHTHSDEIDLANEWSSTVLTVGEMPNTQAQDPQKLWDMPAAQWKPMPAGEKLILQRDERYVARVHWMSPSFGEGVNITFKMPRLDAVHLAYRYDNQPWVRAMAGDTVPMVQWPFPDREPSFDIPVRAGKLDLVVEIAHRGVVDAPMLLQNSFAFRGERLSSAVQTGLLGGIHIVLAIVGLLAALIFKRSSFLAVTGMTFMMAAVVAANSGIAGIYLFTHSAEFNDQAKFFANNMWCVLFPCITAIALSQRFYAPGWWRAAIAWAVLGLVFTLWWMQYPLRGTALRGVPVVALSSIALSLGMLITTLVRGQANAWYTAPGVLLYALSLVVPMVAYLGHMQYDHATLVSAVATMLAAILFLQSLVSEHRQGRMVMSRAKTSAMRDVLTGLLSRKGFETALGKSVQRMHADRVYAAFFYIRVSDAKMLKERYGDEGFEVGMVQLAAAISSSVGVVDNVGRVAPNAFAVTVLMPRESKLANALAQKILTRTMSLASHGAPLAETARIAMAWLPVFGTLLPDIERRCLRTLRKLEEGKRIGWVGGAFAHADASVIPDGTSSPTTKPEYGYGADDPMPSVPGVTGVIDRVEREVFGSSSQQPEAKGPQLMPVLPGRIDPLQPMRLEKAGD
jgi:GGDEF domain-containing protein